MKRKTTRIGLVCIAMISLLCFNTSSAQQSSANNTSLKEIRALIHRIIPSHASGFEIALIKPENGKDVFELESAGKKIILRGNNGVAIASALHHYLKNFAHCHISWNGSNLQLPTVLPPVKQKIKIVSPHQYRYYLNYCTFNYTMSWWDWERWEKEIDWMALNGINMPLSITGQNSVWNKVYKGLGFTSKDLQGFFSGPAYFNWFWMGNLDGWGGPLPEDFMQRQEALHKKILARQRALGMKPILPAFTGHVPPSFKTRFPNARLKKTNWQGFPDVYILDPDDSMFTVIGKRFMKTLITTFGTDHLYSADTFNENTPPTNDSSYLDGISKKVYQSMAAVDPRSVWIMQGWMFSYSAKYWQPTQIKALLNAVPDDKMIILDLYSESKPMWNKTEAYYGKPWIWCMLHNFGGNISLYGRMKQVADDPVAALHHPTAGKIAGIGLTPEAIEQNPALYELMLQHAWSSDPIDLDEWLKGYAYRRYGARNKSAEAAWLILKNTVYNGGISSGGPESIIVSRPTFQPYTRWANTRKFYKPEDLLPALRYLINAADELEQAEGFQYDLVDVARQVLANHADTVQKMFAASWMKKDTVAFKQQAEYFLGIIDDLDELLATRKDFLLGSWLNAAKKWEKTAVRRTPDSFGAEKGLYEKNARNLITLWGDKNSVLHEYSNRQWSGLLTGFYKPRWQQFFNAAMGNAREGKQFDDKAFWEKIKDWEWQWVQGREEYPDKPNGNSIAIVKKLWRKYFEIEFPAFNMEGHRGARGLVPENTIPAMYKAIDYGMHTVEVDVVISKDKKVVISHDVNFVPDITTTPDGRHLDTKEAQQHLLYRMNYDSIRKYDVGLKPHPGFPRQQKIPAYKPLLSELIDSTDAYAGSKGKKILYNIELKTNKANDSIKHPPVEEFVDLVMQVVLDKDLQSRAYLQSFDKRPLQVLHKKYPTIATALLVSGNDKKTLTQHIAELGYKPEIYSPAYSLVTPQLVAECHQLGIKLIPWTVNTLEEMKKLKQMGVDGIITDYPDLLSKVDQ